MRTALGGQHSQTLVRGHSGKKGVQSELREFVVTI